MSHEKARLLRDLHTAPEVLVLVNAWDVVSAKVLADLPGCRAIATASHSIAATLGYEDGERIPRDEMLTMCGRIAAAVDLPVTADLEAGYGDPGETVQRAIDVVIVGCNLEDAMRPLAESVAAGEAVVRASGDLPFVLNARTDAVLQAGDRPREKVLAEAIARGKAYVEAGATVVFVPGKLDADEVAQLVDGIGPVSLISGPGSIPIATMQELGVQRCSLGPWSQRIALTALADVGAAVLAGGPTPAETRVLN